jgi:hypothetical protein
LAAVAPLRHMMRQTRRHNPRQARHAERLGGHRLRRQFCIVSPEL